jgi:16S rRNA (cytosine1402-N4)-methyltransferase
VNGESPKYHEPVLLRESIEALALRPEGVYVDATFGGGGHSRAILEKLGNGMLFAFDQDEEAKQNVMHDERLVFINQNFRYLKKMLRVQGVNKVHGILADLGISSHQVDSSHRGFAHRLEGMLDMRMDQQAGRTAAELLNESDIHLLQRIFSEYGEVRNARTLSEKIAQARMRRPFDTIGGFIAAIEPCIRGHRNRYLSQVFQALRIAVNDELNALKEFLGQTAEVLNEGGRLVVISYHSLEDRIVKNFMRSGNITGEEEKDLFGKSERVFRLITRKPVKPVAEEMNRNPRARSARMRVAERV